MIAGAARAEHPGMRAALLLALCLVLAAAAAGCGGGSSSEQDTPSAANPAPRGEDAPAPVPAPGGDDGSGGAPAPSPVPDLPEGVPTSPDGPAPAGSEAVIRRWLAAVREGDFDAAAATFAPGAKVQNGGPVLRLKGRREAKAWNAMLPCGAKLTTARGAKGYAVLEFRLTDRRGSPCGSGTGAPAYGAIKVRDGKITEWYRLPDPVAPSGDPDAPFV